MNEIDVRNIAWKNYGETDITALALLITCAMAVWMFSADRRRAALPMLVVAHLIPYTVRIVIAGMDFSMLRLLVLVGLARVIARGELRTAPRLNALDWCFGIWVACGSVFEVLQDLSFGTLVYRAGAAIDAVGIYVLMRLWVRGAPEWLQLMRACVPMLVLIACGMAIEAVTARNIFSLTGAPPDTWINKGITRPAGPFGNPILAGSYAASLLPVYLVLIRLSRRALVPALGAAASLAIAIFSHSSGPVMAVGAGLGFLALWPWRTLLPQMRVLALGLAVVIHFAREKPVWHLIGRVAELTGGTGYHRYLLIDAAVNRFGEWWLVGSRNAAYWGWGLQDITNHFIFEGLRGGLWTLLAFVAVLAAAMARAEGALRRAQRSARGPQRARAQREQLLLWGLSAGLASHCVSFVSVTYFGQVLLLFFASLAFIAALSERPRAVAAARAPAAQPRAAVPSPARSAAGLRRPPLLAGPEGVLR
jgi:hypothetical protein